MLNFLVGNDLLSSIIAFGLVLIPAIFIHELGHFLAAKAVGITVIEFGIGFPPRIAKLFYWGETEFTLNILPLGGFVRPLGEDLVRPLGQEAVERDRDKVRAKLENDYGHPMTGDTEVEKRKHDDGYISEREELMARGVQNIRSINEVKPLRRIIFLAAGAFFNFGSALVLFIVIGLLGVPQEVGVRFQVMNVAPGSALAAAGLQNADVIETVNGQIFNTPAEFFSMLKANEGKPVTLSILNPDTGATSDVTITPDASIDTSTGYIHIQSVESGSPADTAGLKVDDLIAGYNGTSLASSDNPIADIQAATVANAGKPMTLDVLRTVNGTQQSLSITVTPRTSVTANQGRIGIGIRDEFQAAAGGLALTTGPGKLQSVPLAFGDSISYGFQRLGDTVNLLLEIPGRLLNHSITPEEARPISIVGISQVGGQLIQQSIEEKQPVVILNFMAVISIALGFTNLLPIPALDGGRILFVLIEIVRGRPIAPEREGMVHLVGMVVLLSIGLIIMLYDLFNPFVLPPQ